MGEQKKPKRKKINTVTSSRFRFTCPDTDVQVMDWVDAQINLSSSLRVIIKDFVAKHGLIDATCQAVPTDVDKTAKMIHQLIESPVADSSETNPYEADLFAQSITPEKSQETEQIVDSSVEEVIEPVATNLTQSSEIHESASDMLASMLNA